MNKREAISDSPGYCSVKDAARMLGGVSEQRVYDLINSGRLRTKRLGRSLGVLIEDVENFQPNMTGRPRKEPLEWHVPPSDNRVRLTLITVQMKAGQRDVLVKRLNEIRQAGSYLFNGTMARYIAESETIPGQVVIELIWRGGKPHEEANREQDLEAFKQALSDVLDWSTAQYNTSKVLLHTSGQ